MNARFLSLSVAFAVGLLLCTAPVSATLVGPVPFENDSGGGGADAELGSDCLLEDDGSGQSGNHSQRDERGPPDHAQNPPQEGDNGSVAATTWYFGRGDPDYFLAGDSVDLSVSGNVHQILSAESNLPLDQAAPNDTSPAVVHTSFFDSLEHPNYAYDAGYWSTPEPVSLLASDVEVIWWGVAPVTGVAFAENFNVTLYRDDQVIATADLQFEGTPAATPTEFNHTFTGVPAGEGNLSVRVDPSGGDVLDTSRVSHEYDYFILYDSVDTPSRIVVTESETASDDDGTLDSEDDCAEHEEALADPDGDGVPVNLTWQAPSPADHLYRIYRDGELVGTTSETYFNDTLPAEFVQGLVAYAHYVVTSEEDGGAEEFVQEFFVTGTSASSSSACAPLIIVHHPGRIPPIWWGINQACLPVPVGEDNPSVEIVLRPFR